MKSLVFTLLLIAAGIGSATADGITVSQSVDRSEIAFEDSVTFTVTLQWPGPQYAYRFDRPLEPPLEGLKIASFASSISSAGTGAAETTTKEYRFKLAPTKAGPDRIDAIQIDFVSYPDSIPGQLMTEPVTIRVAQPAPAPEPGAFGTLWIVLIVSGLFVVAVAIWFYLKMTRRKDVGEEALSPAEIVRDQLETLHKDASGDFKKFQSGLYKVLVGYLSTQYGIEADSLSDDRLKTEVEASALPEPAREKITAWLLTARKDKFRPVDAAPGEAIRLESEVRELFEKL